jgi:lipoate-protein ligase B
MDRPLRDAYWLGRVPYRAAWELQRSLVAAVRSGERAGSLLLLEHPHVFTIGRSGSGEHLLWDEAECRRRLVEVIWSDRGGDATYHGPGQLVGYPILDIRRLGHDILSYLRALERSLMRYLASLGIESESGGPGLTGVWSAGEKVAAIGVKMNHEVVSHGFALNLTTDLEYFDGIVPCGLVGKRATSVEKLGGGRIDTESAARAYATCFAQAFGLDLAWKNPGQLARLPVAEPDHSLSVVGR